MSRIKPWIMPDNTRLNLEQMTRNARIIYSYFRAEGWGKAAICGMLGNMQVESYINPHYWEGGTEGDIDTSNKGYGLTQWTPARKLLQRANIIHPDITDPDKWRWPETQLSVLKWESQQPEYPLVQWITANNPYGISFSSFIALSSESDVSKATECFCLSYEMAAQPNLQLRREYAHYWWEHIGPAEEYIDIWLLTNKRRRVKK